jgi:hypothetical protein
VVPEEEQFPVRDVGGWEIVADETSGDEEKYWLQEPETGCRWLFKAVTIKQGNVQGEDWAEKAVAELAAQLGVPCARIELAEFSGAHGCVSADLRPPDCELQHGQVVLEERNAPGYSHGVGKSHPGHTLENIRLCLEGAMPPPGLTLPFGATAYDVFASYVLLDAWVANRDRHDNNWAVLRPILASGGPLRLSGSYDHASSLGFNLTDRERGSRLDTEHGVTSWCQRGTAWRFGYDPKPTLVDLAAKALRIASLEAQQYWLERFRQVKHDEMQHVLERVPRMSDLARTFAGKVLEVNRRRVLDACT